MHTHAHTHTHTHTSTRAHTYKYTHYLLCIASCPRQGRVIFRDDNGSCPMISGRCVFICCEFQKPGSSVLVAVWFSARLGFSDVLEWSARGTTPKAVKPVPKRRQHSTLATSIIELTLLSAEIEYGCEKQDPDFRVTVQGT